MVVVILTAAVVSDAHKPELTTRLYQVDCVSAAGEYPIALFVPVAAEKPAVALVVELNHA